MDYYDIHAWSADGLPGEYIYGEDIYVDEAYADELWRQVRDFPDYYVSDKGRVWSNISNGFIYGSPMKRSGHIELTLIYNDRRYRALLHRLVAEAFIPNPDNYPIVRHLDDNPANNEVENLAWGTQYDNVQDCIRNGHFKPVPKEDRERGNAIRRRPVVAVNVRTGEEHHFRSIQDAVRCLGLKQSDISLAVCGKRPHVQGWCFIDEGAKIPDWSRINVYHSAKLPYIEAINIRSGERHVFKGLTKAAEYLGMSASSISHVLHGHRPTAKGWKFDYLEEEDL